jgi:hypothetical protein
MGWRLKLAWPSGGLWRHGDFLKLWTGEISQFGTQISQLTLPAGVWIDRLRRRPILIVADLGHAAALASIAIAYFADVLTLGQLYVTAFVTGTLTVFFDVSYQSYLPSLVRRDQLVSGNSALEVSRNAAQIAGPGAGGLLVGLLTALYAVLVDALSFLGSGHIRDMPTEPEPDPEPSVTAQPAMAALDA